jgi:ABC-type Mn2+/Zn2+ transport system permease subunit
MIYSLLANPAVAATRLVRGYGRMLIVSTGLGALSGIGGLLLSAVLDLPTGAMIVILSSLLVALAALIARCSFSVGAAAVGEAPHAEHRPSAPRPGVAPRPARDRR